MDDAGGEEEDDEDDMRPVKELVVAVAHGLEREEHDDGEEDVGL